MKYFTFLITIIMFTLPSFSYADTLTGGGFTLNINSNEAEGTYSGGSYSGTIQSSLPTNQNYYYITSWPVTPTQSSGGGGGGGGGGATVTPTAMVIPIIDTQSVGGGSCSAHFTPLKKGERNTKVKQLQSTLKSLGYFTATVDGYYWTSTIDAVAKFQIANKVVTNTLNLGLFGPATAKTFNKALCKTQKVKSKPVTVTNSQSAGQKCYKQIINEYLLGDEIARVSMRKLLLKSNYISILSGSRKVDIALRLLIRDDSTKGRKAKLIANCPKYYTISTTQ